MRLNPSVRSAYIAPAMMLFAINCGTMSIRKIYDTGLFLSIRVRLTPTAYIGIITTRPPPTKRQFQPLFMEGEHHALEAEDHAKNQTETHENDERAGI